MDYLFYTIWEYNNLKILYTTPKDLGSMCYYVKLYKQRCTTNDVHTYIIYHYKSRINVSIDHNIHYIYSAEDFEPFFLAHMLRHAALRALSPEERIHIASLYDKIHTPYSAFRTQPHDSRRMTYVENQIEIYKRHICSVDSIHAKLKDVSYVYDTLRQRIKLLLDEQISAYSEVCDFDIYTSLYTFPYNTQIFPDETVKQIVLHDVYYKDKVWYNADRTPLTIPEFDNDMEYHFYPKNTHTDISDAGAVEIAEPMMFLDYIYGFYNFGEFWDVMRRLIVANAETRGLPLFHVSRNRITGIAHYFEALGYKYPSPHSYSEGVLYHFNTIYVSTICNSYRGKFDPFFTYQMNMRMNPNLQPFHPQNPISYKLYLTRGTYGRSILDEASLIDILKNKYGFVVLNGSETLDEIQYYFSNASIILGAHGSLMKNMVWCLKNPIFIELTPLTRSKNPCFVGNSWSLGFQTMYFMCECDEKEQIILSDKQRGGLLALVDTLATDKS